jgi:hypothetical protein
MNLAQEMLTIAEEVRKNEIEKKELEIKNKYGEFIDDKYNKIYESICSRASKGLFSSVHYIEFSSENFSECQHILNLLEKMLTEKGFHVEGELKNNFLCPHFKNLSVHKKWFKNKYYTNISVIWV